MSQYLPRFDRDGNTYDKDKIRLWTAIYFLNGGGCYWVKFGHRSGPFIPPDVAVKLAKLQLKQNPDLRELSYVLPGGPDAWGL